MNVNEEISLKNVIVGTVIGLTVAVFINMFFEPSKYINLKLLHKNVQKISFSQEIAPERLFINAWRVTKNSYVDKTLNNQYWMRWRLHYSGKIKTIDDADIAINTMLASLNDPYTKFLKSNSFAKKKMVMDFKITGIGVLFNKTDNGITVDKVIDNSSAQASNIQTGDTIVGINGKNVEEMDIDKTIESIEAGKMDKVELAIKRGDEIIKKTLSKKDIPVQTMNYKITDDNIGIITISNTMGQYSVLNYKKIIEKTNETNGLIIDLRNNYGGVLANAIEMVNCMLDITEIISIDSGINAKYKIYSDGEKIFKEKPLIILINKSTASAAEIFAGTLKDNLNAVLIGENTFGKNSIQHIIPLQNSSGLILTTDKYILPSGNDINHKGLTPDVVIEKNTSMKDDNQLDYSLTLMRKIVKNNK